LKRIGLFGGSFDPVHNAHVALARLALSELKLDEVRWIPVGQQPQKARELAPAADREAMVRLALASEPGFVLERCELRRKGPSFTLDTVRELQEAQPGHEWFLLIGQDQYAGLHTWRDWPELLRRVTVAVANRPGASATAHPDVQSAPHRMVALPMMDISSTEIRTRLAAGQGVADLVPAAVARYIDQHHLYRGTPRS
jgi:nicotinate-nucleotide adenylyltransferase